MHTGDKGKNLFLVPKSLFLSKVRRPLCTLRESLLCVDLQNFLAATQGRAIEVVGRISFRGAAERGNLPIPSDIDYLEWQPLNADEGRQRTACPISSTR